MACFRGHLKVLVVIKKMKIIVSHVGCLHPVGLAGWRSSALFLCENVNFSYCSSVSSQMLF